MPEQDPPSETQAAIDVLLDTLSSSLRREIIRYFENCADVETVTLDELVVHIDGRVPSQTRERTQRKLVHVHLPKLADEDWLDYDLRDGRVRYRGHDDAERLIEEVRAAL